jgi:hypothetical protein
MMFEVIGVSGVNSKVVLVGQENTGEKKPRNKSWVLVMI